MGCPNRLGAQEVGVYEPHQLPPGDGVLGGTAPSTARDWSAIPREHPSALGLQMQADVGVWAGTADPGVENTRTLRDPGPHPSGATLRISGHHTFLNSELVRGSDLLCLIHPPQDMHRNLWYRKLVA